MEDKVFNYFIREGKKADFVFFFSFFFLSQIQDCQHIFVIFSQ